jgi:hypothetical protein
MKRHLLSTALVFALLTLATVESSAQSGMLRTASAPTKKGLIDKKTRFSPERLDSLRRCDDYVMLISSYEGCGPCEWLRTSDVFDSYPVSPYYNDFLLGGDNDLVPYIFVGGGFPTCAWFDRNGDVVAITLGGGGRLYGQADRITKEREPICDLRIEGLSPQQTIAYYNLMYKAAVAHRRGDMEGVAEYAGKALELHPAFYNRYLMYRYHLAAGNTGSAGSYRALLGSPDPIEARVYKKLIDGLNAE